MKNSKKKFWTLNENVMVLVLLLGVVLLAAVYTVQTRMDKKNVEALMDQTLAFMKTQCIRYDNFQASDETKSLMHLIDKAKEFGRCLGKLDDASTESLKNYADEQKLTGLIILDENQKVVCEYNSDGGGYAAWESVILDDDIQEIFQYPQKTYAARRGENDEYDYAVVSRKDEPGIILAYTYQPPVLLDENQIAIENMLTGYKLEMDGTILITDSKKVLSSNDRTLRGADISSCAFINGERRQVSEKLMTVKTDGGVYYGGEARAKGYYLYVFYPSSQVFTQRIHAMLYMLLIYIIFWLAILFIRHKSTRKYMEELNKRYDMELEYQKKLEQAIREAEHANMAKTDFLRRMSHDIRTPINGIRGMIEIGNHFPEDVQKQQECREKIWETSGFLLDLVNDVLDMSKLESGNIQLEEVPFNLSDVLHEVSMLIEVQAKEHGLTFRTVQENGTHWNLIGSPLHLRQMFMNVLSNAVKYNKKNGSVSMSCREVSSDEETAVFEFVCADTGIGMGEDFQKRLFDPFAQEDGTVRTSYSGTGLGLSIVKALVERMNGSIRFDSEKGKGTTFYITLPFQIDKNPPVKEEEPEEIPCETRELEKLPILLVEDNELNMEIAEFVLEEEGALVTKAWNGKEAVEIFEKSAPGTYPVILMDLMMPVMDGLEATRTIRNLPREDAATVAIIAMTANSFNDDVENCRKAGMNEHLSKPLDFGELAETIKKYINSGKAG
ncbi:MAG: ATP-binding protein [Lachnospiraceae bacterium]|nr:ATP-binding protein [Lachnospiraceae bacterium]